MLKYLAANKTWIFSGIGVLILSLLIAGAGSCWQRMASKLSAMRQERGPDKRVLRRTSQAKRVSVGDFHAFAGGLWPIRVQVIEIKRAQVGGRSYSSEQEYVAHLRISGIGLTSGTDVVEIGAESYLVPALDQGQSLSLTGRPSETDRCLFDFDTTQDTFSFVGLCVTHINPRDQWVDISMQEVK